MFVGDTHGNEMFWRKAIFPAVVQHEVEIIVQLGDFGVWPGKPGTAYLDQLDKLCAKHGVPIWFVRGNHDDTTQLTMGDAGDGETLVALRPNIFQIVDGAMIDIDGETLLGVGGAVSIDKDMRVEGRSWWANEFTDIASIDRAVYSEPKRKIDYVVTHDVPEQVDIVSKLFIATGHQMKADTASRNNRAVLGLLFQKLQTRKPKVWLHGHYHIAYTAVVNHTRFIGLDCDYPNHGTQDSWTIIDIGKTVESQEA